MPLNDRMCSICLQFYVLRVQCNQSPLSDKSALSDISKSSLNCFSVFFGSFCPSLAALHNSRH